MPGYRFSDLDARDGVLAVSAVRVKTMPDGEGRVTARGLIKVSFYELERPKNTANMVPTPKTPTPHPYAKDITLNTLWDADSAGSQRAGVILGECNSIMVRPCWHPLGITRSWETGEAMVCPLPNTANHAVEWQEPRYNLQVLDSCWPLDFSGTLFL